MERPKKVVLAILPAFLISAIYFFSFNLPPKSFAAFGDCPSGYEFQRMSGVGCVQKNCFSIKDAHLSYEGYCICGSAGSIAENPNDPNKRCTLPHDNASCPDCVYACVHNDEKCPDDKSSNQPSPPPGNQLKPTDKPGEKPQPTGKQELTEEQRRIFQQLNIDPLKEANQSRIMTAGISWNGLKNVIKRGFAATMTVAGWGINKVSDYQLIQDSNDQNSGWSGMLVAPNGDYARIKVFEGNLDFDWENKSFAAEFNLISVRGREGNRDFIDGFSIGVGPGSASPDSASRDLPGMPISPNINVRSIREYFNERWDGVKKFFDEEVPWPLGGARRPNIGGGEN